MNRPGNISRRRFLGSSATAALSYMFLPGMGRIQARSPERDLRDDYTGRLCYNENPLGPSPLAQQALEASAAMAHRYPDWYSSSLEEQIALSHGLQAGNICIGAGATEVLRLIADAFLSPGDELITATPTYFQMRAEALANGAVVVQVPLDQNYVSDLAAILAAVGTDTRLISLVNPNNPTATIIPKLDMENFLATLPPGILVVVDEAYHHYVQSPDYESCLRFVVEGYPVIVVRTFSKAHGLAGARIGYSIASTDHTAMIAASQLFGTVSRSSQAAAAAALGDSGHLTATLQLNSLVKSLLEAGFNNLGLTYIPSHTNFMMVDIGTEAAPVVAQLADMGYQVRSGWGMPNHIRVSTGLLAETQGFLVALESILTGSVNTVREALPEYFALVGVNPNPFNTQCRITIRTRSGERVLLVIYNTRGQKVRCLWNGTAQPGEKVITWDGRDALGRPVASGRYFINLIQGEFAASRSVTLIK